MNLVEKRRAKLINLAYYAFLILVYYLFMKYAFWLVAPFIIAFGIAMALQKPVRAISKKTRIKKEYRRRGCGAADYRGYSQRRCVGRLQAVC